MMEIKKMSGVNPWIANIWNLFIVLVGALTINSAAELKRSISPNAATPTLGSGTDLNPTPFVDDEGAVPKIKRYLKQQETYCKEKIANHTGVTRVNWCPCLPPNLRGRLSMNEVDDNTWDKIERLVGEDVLIGGEWKPPNCVSHTRMAVVIPCRDRDGHLRILLRHLIPILQRQLVHFRIFVADQSSPVVFNKAATMNIGFLEARKRFNFNCVMFHDVDHLLEDDRTLMNCGPEPHHFALAMREWDYRLNYGNAYGGVGAMTPAMFKKINGYSNIFFGWGGEDDDIGSRIRRHWRILRPPHQIARYSTVNHPPDSSNPGNNKRHHLIRLEQEKYKTGKYDGLSDISYNVSQVDVKNLYTRIVANINVLNLPYPSHPISDYTRVAGVCTNSANIMKSKDVSWQTCRYICDVTKNRPCIGFSYRPTAGSHRCSLLNTFCHLSRSEPGATYFKFGEPQEFTDGAVV